MNTYNEDDRDLFERAMRRLDALDGQVLPGDLPGLETCRWLLAQWWTSLRCGELHEQTRTQARALANKILSIDLSEDEPKTP